MVRPPNSATQDPTAVRMTGLLNASSRSHLGRGANRGSSKCCRTEQPALVRLFENRNCQFEFISLRTRVCDAENIRATLPKNGHVAWLALFAGSGRKHKTRSHGNGEPRFLNPPRTVNRPRFCSLAPPASPAVAGSPGHSAKWLAFAAPFEPLMEWIPAFIGLMALRISIPPGQRTLTAVRPNISVGQTLL